MIRTCEKCGCTDQNPCFHPHWGFCYWPSRTLDICSHCLSKELEEDPETIHCVSGMEFPVLSVHQPYALMLVVGKKEFEYRTWKLPAQYVGKRMFIHATLMMDDFDPQFAEENAFYDCMNTAFNRKLASMILGSVVFGESQGPIDGVVAGVQKKLYKWPVKDPIILVDPLKDIPGKQRIWKIMF